MNLNQVTVSVINIDESIEFYQKLGLILIVKSPHYARFECPTGDATFSIMLENEVLISGTTAYFELENLDEKVNELLGKGLTFEQMPTDETWLWREAILRDLGGNKIILYYAGDNRKNPPWRIN